MAQNVKKYTRNLNASAIKSRPLEAILKAAKGIGQSQSNFWQSSEEEIESG
jgi:hypothetical protein